MSVEYVMTDKSVLTDKRLDEVEQKIQFYRDYVKVGNISDAFYETDLAVIEEGLKLLREQLQMNRIFKPIPTVEKPKMKCIPWDSDL